MTPRQITNVPKNPRMPSMEEFAKMSHEEKRNHLILLYIHKILDEKDKENKLPEEYLKDPWVEVKDKVTLKEVLPVFEQAAFNKREQYRFFIKKFHPALIKIGELEKKKNDIIKEYEREFKVIVFDMNKDKDWLNTRTLYEIEDLSKAAKELRAKEEEQRLKDADKRTGNKQPAQSKNND